MNELGKEARPAARPAARLPALGHFALIKKMWEFSTMAFLYCLSKRKNRPAATKPDDPSSPSSFPLPFLPFLRLAGTHALSSRFAFPAPLLLVPLRTEVASLWGFLLIQVHRSLPTHSFSLQYCTCCCTFVFC